MGDETVGDKTRDDNAQSDIDYWPLLRGSIAAALVTLVSQVAGVVWFGLQAGARVEVDRFLVFPYLRVITTNVQTFDSIIKWSTLFTALAVTVFAVGAFVRRKRLQTQMGRGFGYLDLALLAALHLWGERISPGSTLPTRLMVYVLAFGLIGHFLTTFLVVDSFRLRQREVSGQISGDRDIATSAAVP